MLRVQKRHDALIHKTRMKQVNVHLELHLVVLMDSFPRSKDPIET